MASPYSKNTRNEMTNVAVRPRKLVCSDHHPLPDGERCLLCGHYLDPRTVIVAYRTALEDNRFMASQGKAWSPVHSLWLHDEREAVANLQELRRAA